MPYRFTFDLSRISRFFFTEVATAAYQRDMHRKVGKTVQEMIRKFKIQEATGLNLSDAEQNLRRPEAKLYFLTTY